MRLKTSAPILLASLAVLASCSQDPSSRESSGAESSADSRSGPSFSPTAAPGVAFSYNYNFEVPDQRIAKVQEGHARACEQLGVTKCRITGVTYGVDESDQVAGMLRLKLDPALARGFGKQASDLVQSSDGRLINLAISGDDAGSSIVASQRRTGDLERRTADLEARLAAIPASDPSRGTLASQIESLRQQLSDERQSIQSGQDLLATTPMTFEYYGRGAVPGFHGDPIREAWHTLISTVVTLVRVLLQLLAVLIPLGLLAALIVLLWRSRPMRWMRGWFRPKASAEEQ